MLIATELNMYRYCGKVVRILTDKRAISRAELTCAALCNPFELVKFVLLMPSRRASEFIRKTKDLTLPATASASAWETSFALLIMMIFVVVF